LPKGRGLFLSGGKRAFGLGRIKAWQDPGLASKDEKINSRLLVAGR
jgi:hypothetical protein